MATFEPRRFRPSPHLTGPQAAKEAGIDHDFASRVFRALGFPFFPDTAIEFDEQDVDALKSVKIIMDLGYSDEDVITLSRTFGYALSRIAAAEADSFRRHFIDPLQAEALDADQVTARLEQAVPFLLELQGRLVNHVLRRHLVVALEQEIVLGSTSRTQALAAGFIDLVGFTRTLDDLDPAELGRLVTRFETLCLDTCSDHGVQVVKVIGDAIMFIDSDPSAALKAASAIISHLSTHPDLPEGRAGIDFGDVVPLGGDYFGRPVNVAARLQSFARPGTVVVSDALLHAVPNEVSASRIGRPKLRGVGSIQAYKVKLQDHLA